ncbi:hypothetical protein [Geminocystis sp. GBBB08]|uniref:hypothetical protein n=1 Tax=Geminocystis sp. GBBB08 TaxID=2604140 RepID=UPI0027E27253|nr:hypothetical protein [Geminocystis sp. GBBB08]MBL1208513.1 hypothetical protein [Geminocystis sp. GBBB08]
MIPFAYTVGTAFYDDYGDEDNQHKKLQQKYKNQSQSNPKGTTKALFRKYKIYKALPSHIFRQVINLMMTFSSTSSQKFKTEGDIMSFLVKKYLELHSLLEEETKEPEQEFEIKNIPEKNFVFTQKQAVSQVIYSYLSPIFDKLTPNLTKTFHEMNYRQGEDKELLLKVLETNVIKKLLQDNAFWNTYDQRSTKQQNGMLYNKLKELLERERYSVIKTGHYKAQHLTWSNRTEYTDETMKICLEHQLGIRDSDKDWYSLLDLHIDVRKEYRKLVFDTCSEAVKKLKNVKPVYTSEEIKFTLQSKQISTFDATWQELEKDGDFTTLVYILLIHYNAFAIIGSKFGLNFILKVLHGATFGFTELITQRINRNYEAKYNTLPQKTRKQRGDFTPFKGSFIQGSMNNLRKVVKMSHRVVEGNQPLDSEDSESSDELLSFISYEDDESPEDYTMNKHREPLRKHIRELFEETEDALLNEHPYLNKSILLCIYGTRVKYERVIELLELDLVRNTLERRIIKLQVDILKTTLDKFLIRHSEIKSHINNIDQKDLKEIIKEYLTMKYRAKLAKHIEKTCLSQKAYRGEMNGNRMMIKINFNQLDLSDVLPVMPRTPQELNEFQKAVDLAQDNINYEKIR